MTEPVETDAFFMEEVMKEQYENSVNGWQPGDSIPQNFGHAYMDLGDLITKKLYDPDKKKGWLRFHVHNYEGETFIVEWYFKNGDNGLIYLRILQLKLDENKY